MSYLLTITVYNNQDYEQVFTLKDEDGDVRNLTDHKIIFGIGDEDGRALQVHDSSNQSYNECAFITDAINGQIKLVLPYSVLRKLEPDTYNHDLILVDDNDKREGVWFGKMIVKDGVA